MKLGTTLVTAYWLAITYYFLADALLFLAEGFLPLLHVFYTKYFNLDSCSQSDPKRAISEKICDTILVSNYRTCHIRGGWTRVIMHHSHAS